jgi:hypothetical protein
MTGRGSGRRFAAMGADVVGLVLVVVLTRSLDAQSGAQTGEWTAPYPMLLTPSRAFAMVTAFDRKLAYVPGEVLVRFRSGVTTTGQQRALLSLRSRPAPSDLRWIGDVGVLTDRTELDATILAAQLRGQPEVEFAEPNYLYHPSATPNDPGFTERQWNLTAIDMPARFPSRPGMAGRFKASPSRSG